MSIREKSLAMVLGCMIVFLPARCHAESESGAAVSVIPAGQEVQIPIQSKKSFKFQIPNLSQRENIVLGLDARVQYPGGVGGYSAPLKIALNGQLIEPPRLINKPMVFKTAAGTNRSWFKKTHRKRAWILYYAKSFDIINKESKYNKYRILNGSGSHFVFDITDIAQEENILTIENLYNSGIQKMMKTEVPIVTANIKVSFPEKIVKSVEEEKALQPVSYVMPRKDWKVNYKFTMDKKGGFVVTIGGKSFPFASYFSYPQGGYNAFSRQEKGSEENWKVTVTGTEKKYQVYGEGEFYKVSRKIELSDNRIDIFDTVLNKSKEKDLGIIVKNQTDISGIGVEKFFLGGNEVFFKEGSSGNPENPTFYMGTSAGGIGLVPVDDVFRVHHTAYREKNICGLKDDKFALAPGGEYTMEWSIYPTSDNDHFTFINALRRDWDLNSFLAGGEVRSLWNAVSLKTEPNQIPAILEKTNCMWPQVKYVSTWLPHIYPPDITHYIPISGYPFLKMSEQDIEKYKILIKAINKELDPRIKLLGYYGPPTFSVGKESSARFKESWITRPNGEQVCGEGENPYWPLFYPTETNDFGKMLTAIVDRFLDWGTDGIYFDYFDPSNCGTAYTYNTWDGHTAQIDPKTKTIKRKYASIDLLSCKFLASIVKRVENRGAVLVANRGITTKTSNNASKNIQRLGECGALWQLPKAQLTPCPVGFQRTHITEPQAEILAALDYGMLTFTYEHQFSFPDNPIAKMFPIKVQELHKGYVFGENKIVTKRSGTYGFDDKSKITCFLYDKEGHAIPNDFPVVSKGDKSFIKVDLSPGQLAILKREL